MAADTLAHAPVFSAEEVRSLRDRFLRDLLYPAELDSLEVLVYAWATPCWKCSLDVYVWMNLALLTPTIGADCLRADIRVALSKTNATPHALIGEVTTKAGGTYLGYTCPWCNAVQGKHFLTIDLYQRLLRDDNTVDQHLFEDALTTGARKPATVAAELKGNQFPQTREQQFREWRTEADQCIADRVAHGKYRSKRENMFINWMRLSARFGQLAPERRAYLDIHLNDWLPETPTISF